MSNYRQLGLAAGAKLLVKQTLEVSTLPQLCWGRTNIAQTDPFLLDPVTVQAAGNLYVLCYFVLYISVESGGAGSQPITLQIHQTPQGTRLMIPSSQLSQLQGKYYIARPRRAL